MEIEVFETSLGSPLEKHITNATVTGIDAIPALLFATAQHWGTGRYTAISREPGEFEDERIYTLELTMHDDE